MKAHPHRKARPGKLRAQDSRRENLKRRPVGVVKRVEESKPCFREWHGSSAMLEKEVDLQGEKSGWCSYNRWVK